MSPRCERPSDSQPVKPDSNWGRIGRFGRFDPVCDQMPLTRVENSANLRRSMTRHSGDGAVPMRRLLPVLALAALSQTASADNPPAAPADTEVQPALAEVPASDSDTNLILRTSGTLGRSEDWRPGLLGHRYVQGRYVHLIVDTDSGLEDILDDSAQGFDATLNLPVPRLREETGFLGVDLFVSHRYVALSSDTYFPPPVDVQVKFDADVNQTDVGAALYIEHARLGPARPFVQLGAHIDTAGFRIAGGGASLKEKYDDVRLLVAPGLELDLWDFAAVRATFDLETDELEDTQFLGDIILWPADRLFVRGGIVAPFNGSGVGGTIGGGVEF